MRRIAAKWPGGAITEHQGLPWILTLSGTASRAMVACSRSGWQPTVATCLPWTSTQDSEQPLLWGYRKWRGGVAGNRRVLALLEVAEPRTVTHRAGVTVRGRGGDGG